MKTICKLILILFFYSNTFIFSQEKRDSILPVKKILKLLEDRYNVSFSFGDKTVENISTRLPKKDLTLDEALDFLNSNTNLSFDILSNRFISIKKQEEVIVSEFFEDLNEVSVTGFLTSGISKNKDGSLELKTKNLGILPGLIEPDVLQAIQALPGVVSASESISDLNIRGGTHDQNLILFDGIRMYQSGHFFGLITAFNPHLNYKTKLSKNGISSKYGENISSVIDMKLPNKISDKTQINIGGNLLSFDFLGILPLSKKIELQIATRRSNTDFLKTFTFNEYFNRAFQEADINSAFDRGFLSAKNEKFSFYDVFTKFLYRINDKNLFKLVLLNIENNLNYEENLKIDDDITNDDTIIGNSVIEQKNFSLGITYEGSWNSWLTTEAKIYTSRYNLISTYYNYDETNINLRAQANEVIDNGFKLDTNFEISKKTNVSTGYHFSQIGISNTDGFEILFASNLKQVLNTHSLYSQLNYNEEDFYLKAGLRANYYEKFGRLFLEPRFAFNYKLSNTISFEINSSLRSQATSQIIDLDADFLGIERERWVLAGQNPVTGDNFPIITNQQIGVGGYYKKDGWLINVEAYHKLVNNINSKSQGFQNRILNLVYNLNESSFVGSYRVKGVDLLIQKKINNLRIGLGYSYTKNDYIFEDLNNGNPFPSNFDIRNVLNVSSTYIYNNFDFAIGFNWYSGKPYTEIKEFTENNDPVFRFLDVNNSRQKDYYRLDASVNYNFKIGNVNLISGISVWNILNRRNILNTYYSREFLNFDFVKTENTSLGLTPNLSLRVKF